MNNNNLDLNVIIYDYLVGDLRKSVIGVGVSFHSSRDFEE